MPETFDAYHKWLGIPPHERPPHHYRLLAIDLFESDLDVIASAADQRMAHVRTFQAGRHAALSQTILNEIAAARVCLLNPEKKTEYDQKLRMRLVAWQAPPAVQSDRAGAVPSLPERVSLPQPAFEATVAGHLVRRRRSLWKSLAAFAVAAAVCGAVVAVVLRGGRPPEVVQVAPAPPVVPPDVPKNPATLLGPDDPHVPPTPEPPPETNPPSADPVEPPPAQPPATPEPPPADPAPSPIAPQRAPLPDDDALAAAEAALQPAVAAGNPRQLMSQVLGGEQPPAECFYLLSQAKKLAAEAGDAAAAWKAEEELLARFEVDAIQTKADTLKTLAQSSAAADAAQLIAENCLAIIDSARAVGEDQLASELAVIALKSARQAGHSALERQATLKILELSTLKAPPGDQPPADPAPASAPAEPPPAT
jgi:hypothetical protein